MLDPFATASRRTPLVLILHCHSPGVATVARRLRYSNVKSMSTMTTTTTKRDRMGPMTKCNYGNERRTKQLDPINVLKNESVREVIAVSLDS